MIADRAERLRSLVSSSGAALDDGLGRHEIEELEGRLGFQFGPDHRELLTIVLPVGARWVDWRHDSESELRSRLEWPVDSVMFHVERDGFWPGSWGKRPVDPAAALDTARENLRRVPKLVPIYSHRFLPAAPCASGTPVLSVYGTDTIYYGSDLEDYLEREFVVGLRARPSAHEPSYVRFWSELAEDRESDI